MSFGVILNEVRSTERRIPCFLGSLLAPGFFAPSRFDRDFAQNDKRQTPLRNRSSSGAVKHMRITRLDIENFGPFYDQSLAAFSQATSVHILRILWCKGQAGAALPPPLGSKGYGITSHATVSN